MSELDRPDQWVKPIDAFCRTCVRCSWPDRLGIWWTPSWRDCQGWCIWASTSSCSVNEIFLLSNTPWSFRRPSIRYVEIRRAGTEIKSTMTAPGYILNRTRDSLVRLFACILLFFLFSFWVNASSPHVLCRIELAFLLYFTLVNGMSMHDVLWLVL